ncbi:MAG TPA: hypothetical protein VFV55_06825 [Usitatibacteraceae bacterium]|nr:hypothetical protein [Usitatibacteraceae bacterium]
MNTPDDTLHPAVREARLTERFDALRSELARVRAPAHLEASLVEEFRSRRAGNIGAARPRLWWMPPLAMAATVAAVSWMVRAPGDLPVPDPAIEFTIEPAARGDAGPFLALTPLERIALEPQATVVTTEFPRALLAQWGLPVSPERAGEPVRAEMLYSAEGEALAVRVLN